MKNAIGGAIGNMTASLHEGDLSGSSGAFRPSFLTPLYLYPLLSIKRLKGGEHCSLTM